MNTKNYKTQLAEEIYNSPSWKVFLLFFGISFTIFLPLMMFLEPELSYTSFIIASLLSSLIGMFSNVVIQLGKQSEKFYKEADKIEEMIKSYSDKDEVIDRILNLNKTSFHRVTSQRVRELAKMAEVKYNVKLLKN